MKHILLSVVTLMVITMLFSVNITPDSPGYDAYKRSLSNQSATPSNVTTASVGNQVIGDQSKDAPALLIPLDGTFTLAMGPNDDGSTDQINLGFTFSLYGDEYTSCYINNNGNITFSGPEYSYSSWPFPIESYPMLAAFFADVDTRGAGAVYYRI